MYERFTEKAIKVIMLAQEEARRLGHGYVGTEQILLGLIGEGSGIAAKSLKSAGNVNLKDTRIEVEKIIGRGSGFVSVEMPLSPRVKRVLELAWDEARQLGHNYVGTEHLLLGIIRDGDGKGVHVLTDKLGVDLKRLRAEVLHQLGLLGKPQAPQVSTLSDEEIAKLGPGSSEFENRLKMLGSEINKAQFEADTLTQSGPTLEAQIVRLNAEIANLTLRRDQLQEQVNNLPNKIRQANEQVLAKTGDLTKFYQLWYQTAITSQQEPPTVESATTKDSELERFTENALKVMLLAQEEAKQLGHNYVGTEMILLGLIGESTGYAYKILKAKGVTLKDARGEAEKIIGRASDVIGTEIPYTPRAKRLLELSWDEARKLGKNHQDTEHLLLGLIREGEGVAARILENLDVDLDKLRAHLLSMIREDERAASEDSTSRKGTEL